MHLSVVVGEDDLPVVDGDLVGKCRRHDSSDGVGPHVPVPAPLCLPAEVHPTKAGFRKPEDAQTAGGAGSDHGRRREVRKMRAQLFVRRVDRQLFLGPRRSIDVDTGFQVPEDFRHTCPS